MMFQHEKSSTTSTTPDPFGDDDDDDDDFGDSMNTASSSGGGSNLFSLLNLAGALFPGSSRPNVSIIFIDAHILYGCWQTFSLFFYEYCIRYNYGRIILQLTIGV